MTLLRFISNSTTAQIFTLDLESDESIPEKIRGIRYNWFMKLHFVEKSRSVEPFEDIIISDFCIFTGRNGSGKTHILQAIKEGYITVDDLPKKQILYLNYLDFEHNFQVRTDQAQSSQAWNRLNPSDKSSSDLVFQLKNLEGSLDPYKKEIESVSESKNKRIFDLTKEDFPSGNGLEIINLIKNYRDNLETKLEEDNYLGDEVAQSVYDSVILKSQVFLSNISEADFLNLYRKTAISNRKILSDLSSVFLGYYRSLNRNIIKKAKGERYYSDTEFTNQFGLPPWEMVRNIFTGFELSFDVNDPIEEKIDELSGSFQIAFKHTEKQNRPIPFNNLSSGERILITLVNAIYTSRQKVGLPKLILLDEIDGPLNPSIISKFISYLEDNFISTGIKIILATHSPSTVAFAPEDSIYVINTNNSQPIAQESNKDAIRILSDGFITFADIIEFEQIPESTIVISEGKNFNYLNKAKGIHSSNNSDLVILDRNIGGTTQVRTLFDLMRVFNTKKNFIFVFDCDYRLKEKRDADQGIIKNPNGETEYESRNFDDLKEKVNKNNRIFVFQKEPDSDSDRGIENLFNKSVTSSFGGEFDNKSPKNKKIFERYILDRSKPNDFKNFKSLFDFINGRELHNL